MVAHSRRRAFSAPLARLVAGSLIIAAAAAAFTAPPRGSCGVGFPLAAAWQRGPPPFLRPAGCELAALPPAELRRCLSNRTVYVLGNSVGRNYAFETAAMMQCADAPLTRGVHVRRVRARGGGGGGSRAGGGRARVSAATARRHAQKAACDMSCGTTCRGTGAGGGATAVRYAKVQLFGAHLPTFPRAADVCGVRGTTAACLARFFAGATPRDALVFNIGLHYAVTVVISQAAARRWPPPRLRARAAADAAALPAVLRSLFPGRVYYVTTGPASPGKWVRANRFIHDLNDDVVAALGATRALNVTVVDQHAISNGRWSMYNDYVHIAGPLTRAALAVLWGDACAAARVGEW